MRVILAVEETMTQAQIAQVLRERWHELWKLPPAERRARIEEIMNPQKDAAR